MNETQNELNHKLEELCSWMYEGDKKKCFWTYLLLSAFGASLS